MNQRFRKEFYKKGILLFAISMLNTISLAQNAPNLLKSKDQMVASATIYYHFKNPLIKKDFDAGSDWRQITFNSQWFQFEYGFGEAQFQNYLGARDTLSMRETALMAHFPIQKLIKGRRIFDIKGALMVPALSGGFGFRRLNNNATQSVFKLAPSISFQFPFVGIDFRLNTNISLQNKGLEAAKNFSFYPEIGIKIDGLYNMMDAERMTAAKGIGVYNKLSSWTTRINGIEYNLICIETIPYKWERNTTIVGTFTAIAPHYAFRNFGYAGQTKMVGLGYYIRSGFLYSDLLIETGKVGFASEAKEKQTIDNYSPGPFFKVNKESNEFAGQYRMNRFYGRIGVDLFEIFAGQHAGVDFNDTKFTRCAVGLGLGYAQIKGFEYEAKDGLERADKAFDADLTLLATSRNHAKFGTSGAFFTFYASIEAGALVYTVETSRYFQANLANTTNFSVAYLFPYSRFIKKYKAIKAYKLDQK
jgi:hypothetical protein